MYHPSSMYLSDVANRALTDLETDLGRPIRVINGRGRMTSPGDWSTTQARVCYIADPEASGGRRRPTVEECEADGVTIVHYGSFNEVVTYGTLTFPHTDDFWSGDYRTDIHDSLVPADPLQVGWAYEAGGEQFAEISERAVAFRFSLDWFMYLNLETFLRGPVMASLDPNALAEYEERMEEVNRQRFFTMLQEGGVSAISRLNQEIGRLMSDQASAEATLESSKIGLRSKQAELALLLDMTGEDELQARREASWDSLKAHPKIEHIRLTAATIMFETTDLTLTHPETGVVAPLGKFRITIDPKYKVVRVNNLTNRKGEYDHPHVYNGEPCFGNMRSAIYEMLVRNDLAGMIEIMLVFLGSVNLQDDWGRHATYWFSEENLAQAESADEELVAA